jgi:hemolysin III
MNDVVQCSEAATADPSGALGGTVDRPAIAGPPLDAYGFRPFWRGRAHLIAALVTVPAAVLLLLSAHSALSRVAVAVYVTSLIGLFAVSASYHRIARTPTRVKWFRRADHSMIFILIAGTYTPICLLALPRSWGIPLLVVVWAAALAGVTLKMARLGNGPGSSGSWLYIVIGWGAVIAAPALVSSLDGVQLALMAAGGLLYTVGAVVLARRWPDPLPHSFGYHEIWHTMTVAAGGCHFVLIALVLP